MNFKFIFICFLFSTTLAAQPFFDLVRLNGNVIPTENNRLIEQRLQINFPFNPNGKHKVLIGFQGRKIDTNNKVSKLIADGPFYDYSAYLACNYAINEKWESYLRLTPGWRYQGEDNSGDSFQAGFISLTTYKKSNRLQYKFGLFYNDEAFGNFFAPLLGIDYRINEKWRLFILAPGYSRIQYNLVPKKWYTGFAHFSPINSYISRFQKGAYVRQDQILLYGFLERDLPMQSTVILQLGYSAKNDFTVNDFLGLPGQSLEQFDESFSGAFYASLGIAIRFRS